MRLADKVATMARRGTPLPYDAEVEWLKGDGASFIDCGINGDSVGDFSIVFKRFYDQDIPLSYLSIISGRNDDFDIDTRQSSDSTVVRVFVRRSMISSFSLYAGFEKCNIFSSEGSLYHAEDGASPTLLSIGVDRPVATQSTNIVLFGALNASLIVSNFFNGYIFEAKLYGLNRTYLRDMIPVRFTNENGVSEGAMYDRVSGQLFRNQGTGAFIIGPDKASNALSREGGGY